MLVKPYAPKNTRGRQSYEIKKMELRNERNIRAFVVDRFDPWMPLPRSSGFCI
jgi:hypothetical protein